MDILNNDQRAKFAADIVSVRVNDLGTPFFEDDFKSILTANQKPEMIIIPKVNDPAEMSKVKYKQPSVVLILHIDFCRLLESSTSTNQITYQTLSSALRVPKQ